MEAHELEAYGLCGLSPETFAALTVPEFHSLLEAAYWREARQVKLMAQMVAQLLRPYMKETQNTEFFVDDLLGGDPVSQVETARAQRLAARRRAEERTS